MNSRLSPSLEAIDPSVRERAEAAARRAGMSLNDWLSSTASDSRTARSAARPPLPDHDAKEVAEIHQRLDSITQQIEHMSRPAPRSEPGVAYQLNEAISRLDARLSQLNEPAPRQGFTASPDTIARNTPPPFNPPPIAPGTLEAAIAEITARQNELNAANARATPPLVSPSLVPPIAPSAPTPAPAMSADLSGLERQLSRITHQIDGLRPDAVEQSIAAFRNELADIRHTITEAMPRRAIESIENEIRSLSRRIDDSRHSGGDGQALAGVERALNEIREVLHSLTPAEQLAGFDNAIRSLGGKIDMIVRASGDPGTIRQLEDAIAALRAIVSNVASNESLGRLSDDVRILASKVDQFSHPEGYNEGFAALEQRIAALATTLEKRPQGVIPGHSEHLEGALQALSDRLDHLPVGNDSTSAFAHLEQRVSYLLERLELANDPRNNQLGRVEEGLQDVLRHLERQSASFATPSDPVGRSPGMDPSVVEAIHRELSEMRFTQTETDRHTQDSLEAVHNTLGHVVDRLAMIESDLRATKSAQAAPVAPAMPAAPPMFAPAPVAAAPVAQTRPELPNPAAMRTPVAPAAIASAAPKAISEILDLQKPSETRAAPRIAIDSELPPDHPLEPGTRRAMADLASSADDTTTDADASREPANASSFIAAARRAAQAAASATATDKSKRGAAGGKADASPSTVTSKIRSLLVGASVVVIVLGSFKMAMSLLDDSAPPPAAQVTGDAVPEADSAAKSLIQPAPPVSPTSIGRQSLIAPAPSAFPFAQEAAPATTPAAPSAPPDVTGSITPPQASSSAPTGRKPSQIAIPAGEKLPDTIGGPALRAAALKGDPTAAYEIGVRFAEARGVVGNYDEAAKWYDRAAQAGLVPAMFRLGTLYEKGLSVRKDIDLARRCYTAAAERGNAKAMHNLAVLDADGGAAGANYKSASQWFRKAADRGVADSQYNLGILYARGIGVEQNLAESFKWFSLAAAQGDADSAKKRDDVAKKLDPQSLAAAKLAIQTFTPEPQPDDAVTVATPAGGWDAAPAQPVANAKPATTKRAAAAPR